MKHKPLRGDRNQCAGCGLLFNSSRAFDKHRIGRHGIDRRCMTQAEMSAAGMLQRADGFWVGSAMPDVVRDAVAACSLVSDPQWRAPTAWRHLLVAAGLRPALRRWALLSRLLMSWCEPSETRAARRAATTSVRSRVAPVKRGR